MEANMSVERFQFDAVGRLSDFESREAITRPALAQCVAWDTDALDVIVCTADGYPYFLHLYAVEAWILSGCAQRVTAEHARASLDAARRQLDAGLYADHWSLLTEGECDYVAAMVAVIDNRQLISADAVSLGERGRVRSADVAAILDRSPASVSQVRDRVIKKGVVFSPQRGQLAFSIPGFGDYVARVIAARVY